MNVFIAGGSGFIGTHLSRQLLALGHAVTVTGSRSRHLLAGQDRFCYIPADTTEPGAWQQPLASCDMVINLAGKSIFRHWTDRYKETIHASRILTTRHLVAALPEKTSIVFCSASGVGCYGNRAEDLLTEKEPFGDDFLAKVCHDWEAEALNAERKGARVVLTRFGVILGKDGGAMAKMIPAFRLLMGGAIGDGRQWFPWLHIDDLTAALLFIMDHPQISGPVNFCTPHPVRNRDLARMLGSVLSRPAVLSPPPFLVKLFLGEFGETLLASQRAVPEKLSGHGFQFKFAKLESALQEIVDD
jgi:uncharacterized protein (TIGR01777 family)